MTKLIINKICSLTIDQTISVLIINTIRTIKPGLHVRRKHNNYACVVRVNV